MERGEEKGSGEEDREMEWMVAVAGPLSISSLIVEH